MGKYFNNKYSDGNTLADISAHVSECVCVCVAVRVIDQNDERNAIWVKTVYKKYQNIHRNILYIYEHKGIVTISEPEDPKNRSDTM